MSVCSNVKGYARHHEWLADLFSLMAVALLFASVWAILQYNELVLAWLQHNLLLHTPILVAGLVLDVTLIFGLICVGSARCEDGGCFRTFRGRRHGAGSVGKMFTSWLHHMEHVGRRHR